MKNTSWLKIKLKLLLKKRAGIVEYNLSGSGWQDYYSSSERDNMYTNNDYTQELIAEVEAKIVKTAYELMAAGYTREQLITGFNGLEKYLPKEVEETNTESTPGMHM